MDSLEIKQYADTMFAQMGGDRFLVTTGSKLDCYGKDNDGNPFIIFKLCDLRPYLPNQKVRPNRFMITLDLCSDTYRLEFYRLTTANYDFRTGKASTVCKEIVTEYEDVYCDQLQDIFEKDTKLLLDFCRVHFG